MINKNPILKETARVMVPVIVLYALYIQFHGDFGPGGGFQAGVIFAIGIILHALIFGLEKNNQVIKPIWCQRTAAIGLLLFCFVGFVGILRGSKFLDYNVLMQDPLAGQHVGIFLVELGIGLGVAGMMLSLFYALVLRGKQ